MLETPRLAPGYCLDWFLGSSYLQLTLVAAIWGSSWMAASILSRNNVPAIYSSLGRFTFGGLGLLVIMWRLGAWPKPSRSVLLRLIAMGFFGVFAYNICFFTGLRTVPSGRASLMAALQPSLVFLYTRLFWGERATPLKIGGIVLSLGGSILVLTQGNPAQLFANGLGSGDVWILGTVVSWVSYTLIGRSISAKIDSLPATAYAIWAGLAMLILYAALTAQPLPDLSSPSFWWITLYLGILGTTLGFLFYQRGLEKLGAARTSIFINLVPVFSVLSSSLFLGEAVTPPTLIGGALALCGVWLLNR